jgi:hypothetical protein
LRQANIGPEGAKAIASVLEKNTVIEVLRYVFFAHAFPKSQKDLIFVYLNTQSVAGQYRYGRSDRDRPRTGKEQENCADLSGVSF